MALICYYAQHFIASTYAKSGILPDTTQPALSSPGLRRKAVLTCCEASRVRRSTAATGE